MVNKTPWGIHKRCIHPRLSSHSRLFCPESSNNRKFVSGVNQWVTSRGTWWRLWWREKWGWLMCPPRSSWRCSVFHGRFMFVHVLLGTRSEFTPRAAGGIILNGGRCDPADICNHATLRRTEEERIEVFAFMGTNQLHEAFGSNGSASFKTDGMHSHQYQEKRLLNSSHLQKWQ